MVGSGESGGIDNGANAPNAPHKLQGRGALHSSMGGAVR